MNHSRFTTSLTLTCLLILSTGIASAQNTPKNETKVAVDDSRSLPASSGEQIRLKFPGGNAADYIAAVKAAMPSVNVFVAPEVREVSMPALELNNVSVAAALGLLNARTATSPTGQTIQLFVDEGERYITGEQPIFNIVANYGGPEVRPAQSMNRVWSVARILSTGLKSDDMLTAVQTALDLLGNDVAPAQIRFHEATGILIARASLEQLKAIDEVVSSLEQSGKVFQASAFGKTEDQRDKVIEQLQMRINALEAELAKAKKQ